MAMFNLTAPLGPERRLGTGYPWDSPYLEEDIVSIEFNGAHLIHLEFGSNVGTRLLTSRMFDEAGTGVDEIDLERLAGVPTLVHHVDEQAGGVLDVEQVDVLLRSVDAEPEAPEGVLVATGAPDRPEGSACLEARAAARLAEGLRARGTRLFLTDLPQIDPVASSDLLKDWVGEVPWRRPPWPSGQAAQFLRFYGPEAAARDFAAVRALVEVVPTVVGLDRCTELPTGVVTVFALPMFVRGAGSAPCTVICIG